MDVKFEVQDLFEKLRPNAKIHETLEEAAEALNEIVARQFKPTGLENVGEGSDGASEKSDDEQDDQRARVDEDEPEEEEQVEDMEVLSGMIVLTPD
jgi:hypothetical protein